jgi:hypothetical protein
MTLTLTYGHLPTKPIFDRMFAEQCPTGFLILNCKRVGNHNFTTSDALYNELSKAVNEWVFQDDNESGSWASAVLTVLGVEWV